MSTSTITVTLSSTLSTSPEPDSSECGQNDLTCNPVGLLIAVILLVLLLYIILALTRILLCFVYRRRQQNTAQIERTNREIEEIGHPFSYLAGLKKESQRKKLIERGFDNSGFDNRLDPPPTYEQLFKRDDTDPPPVYETPAMQRRSVTSTPMNEQFQRHPSSSSITSAPATYIRTSEIPRSTSRSSLPIGVFGTSVPPVSSIMIDESYRSRNNTMADSPENGFSRPTLLVPASQEPLSQSEAGSPTKENLI